MKIGITSTIPSEIILAAGHTIVDLNNAFMSHKSPRQLVSIAEKDGYPSSCCGWIRGIYGTVKELAPVDAVLTVTGGDCSNTHAMAETFEQNGIPTIPFSYPLTKSREELEKSIEALASHFGVSMEHALETREMLEPIRKQLDLLDNRLIEGKIPFSTYHSLSLSSSDYESDLQSYAEKMQRAVELSEQDNISEDGIRIALLGVPPIITDLEEILAECGFQVVFDEIPRQFTMPYRSGDIVEQYLSYTYPYGMLGRLRDIKTECNKRRVTAVVHYTQSFCFRAIEDVVLRKNLNLPILTIEGDEPSCADERLKLRLESFAEMLMGV